MDWDFEAEDPRPRYRLCRAGFGLIALALGLLTLDAGLDLALWFTRDPAIAQMTSHRFWTWLVGAPITWGSLLGSYLLWGRWPEPRWQRRAGLLLLMNAIDGVSWAFNNAELLGLGPNPLPHAWLRGNVSMAMGWAELALIAGLASDLSAHLGKGRATEAAQAARSFSGVGACLWCLSFAVRTNWGRWPLIPHRLTPETFLLLIGSLLLLALTSFQVTLLCFLAARQSAEMVRELDREDRGHELLRSRSETEDDPWR